MGAWILGITSGLLILSALWSSRKHKKPGPGPGPKRDDPKPDDPKPFVPITPGKPDAPDPYTPFTPIEPTPIEPYIPPKPDEPKGPDPYKPTPTPTPGQYYQVKKGDVPSTLARNCYPTRSKPVLLWNKVAAHALNKWLSGHLYLGADSGGFMPQWAGWLSKWESGHQYGLYYWPTETEMDK